MEPSRWHSRIAFNISRIEFKISRVAFAKYWIQYFAYRVSCIAFNISRIAFNISRIVFNISRIVFRPSHIVTPFPGISFNYGVSWKLGYGHQVELKGRLYLYQHNWNIIPSGHTTLWQCCSYVANWRRHTTKTRPTHNLNLMSTILLVVSWPIFYVV